MPTTTPKKAPPPPPPPPPKAAPPPAATPTDVKWGKSKGARRVAHRVGIYGPGGIGKSTIAAHAPGARFVDLERGTDDLAVERIDAPDGKWTWDLLRAAVQDQSLWETAKTIVLDTATAAEELCINHVLRTVAKYEGQKANGLEDYGFGKGYTYVYEQFLLLLSDLDAHIRAGRNVVLLMHDITAKVPNPVSEDFLRFEPRLQPTAKNSIRHRVREWLDHLFFLGYDVAVTKGKARGGGSRTIYPQELPWAMAKSRTLTDLITFDRPDDDSLWTTLIPTKE